MQAVVPGAICIAALSYIILFVPPSDPLLVGLVIVLFALASYFFILATKMRHGSIIPIFVGLFFIMNVLNDFQVINTILLISFIIGLFLLRKK